MLKLVTTLTGHEDRVWCVAWNPQGDLLASCGGDRKIKIWSKNKSSNKLNDNETSDDSKSNENFEWKCINTLSDGHNRTIRWVSWSPCGNKLASASFDTSITIWKKKENDFEIIANLEGHENEVKCTAWSNDGLFLASCSRDRSVWIWDVSEDEEYECSSVLTIHSQDVKHVLWHPNKNMLVSSSYDNTIKISIQCDDDWSCVSTLESHESTVWSCDFNKDGKILVSSSDDKTLKFWKEILDESSNLKWKCICTVSGYHSRTIFSVKWSRLNNLIATACSDNSIYIFKENNNSLTNFNINADNNLEEPMVSLVLQQKDAHGQDCNCVDWNPAEANLLASCSDDGTIKLWNFTETN